MTIELDPEIANLCDAAPAPTCSLLSQQCAEIGVTVEAWWDFFLTARRRADMFALKMASRRLYTGYKSEPNRRAFRHSTYCHGLRAPEDRTARDMRKMGLRR